MVKKQKDKIRVAVFFGGDSNEREISLVSGKTVIKNLNPKKFSFFPYDTKKDLAKLFSDAKKKKFDVVFIALHGRGGEDGTIQGMMELLRVPYTGSGVLASAVGMDKLISKKLFQKEKILTPRFFFLDSIAYIKGKFQHNIKIPCVVKPRDSGSSVGVSIINSKKDLSKAVKKAFFHSQGVIIEEYIAGQEITVSVLGNEKPFALPVVGIYPKKKFFDYQAKYDPDFCQEIVPAPIAPILSQKAKKLALKVYKLIGCEGFSRIDMMLKRNKIYVLEINTIPGLTPNSLLPKAAEAAGISFSALLEKIIKFALAKKNKV